MARVELIMPKMGESVSEATIITWTKEIGDLIEIDETIVEIATDKVDSEVPSTHEGKLVEKLFKADDVVLVGQAFAILETEGGEETSTPTPEVVEKMKEKQDESALLKLKQREDHVSQTDSIDLEDTKEKTIPKKTNSRDKFYSPLVKSMAAAEGVTMSELDGISGSGKKGRVTKSDMLTYLKTRNIIQENTPKESKIEVDTDQQTTSTGHTTLTNSGDTEIIEMDRMRKLISTHMTMSKQTSAHITSFVEADMTNIVNWRNKIKADFKKRENQNITFTPIIIEAMSKAVKDFPMINVSVSGTDIHIHKNVNIGMAAALPDGNLIVPVIKQCQEKNLVGITKSVNDLATRARGGQLKPDDIQGGTITMTNVGTFGNLMGTPIINQPQVAIMACGVIKKKPVVLETEVGDVIAIRHMMFLSLSYDHRVVDGALGGQFVRRVADYLEGFDKNTVV